MVPLKYAYNFVCAGEFNAAWPGALPHPGQQGDQLGIHQQVSHQQQQENKILKILHLKSVDIRSLGISASVWKVIFALLILQKGKKSNNV